MKIRTKRERDQALIPISVGLNVDHLLRVRRIAADEFLTPSAVVREAVQEFLERRSIQQQLEVKKPETS